MSAHFAVKRITAELKEMQKKPAENFVAGPLESDLFEWHFTVKGPADTPYEGGLYHGRLILPTNYPYQPPKFIILTVIPTQPNGRFETMREICMSNSSFHPDLWQPAWTIRTMLEGLVSFFPEEDSTGIGAIRTTKELRRELAKMSQEWRCDVCGKVMSEIWQDNESKRKVIEEEEKCRKESIDLGRERDENGEIEASRKVSEEVIRKTSDIPEHTHKIHPIPLLEERKHNEPILNLPRDSSATVPDPEIKPIFTSSPHSPDSQDSQDSSNAHNLHESINTSDQNSNPSSIPEIPAFKPSPPDPLFDEKYSHLPSVSEVRAFQKSASRHILGLDIVIAVLFLVWAYVRYFLI